MTGGKIECAFCHEKKYALWRTHPNSGSRAVGRDAADRDMATAPMAAGSNLEPDRTHDNVP